MAVKILTRETEGWKRFVIWANHFKDTSFGFLIPGKNACTRFYSWRENPRNTLYLYETFQIRHTAHVAIGEKQTKLCKEWFLKRFANYFEPGSCSNRLCTPCHTQSMYDPFPKKRKYVWPLGCSYLWMSIHGYSYFQLAKLSNPTKYWSWNYKQS
jgi:hypothetical protein